MQRELRCYSFFFPSPMLRPYKRALRPPPHPPTPRLMETLESPRHEGCHLGLGWEGGEGGSAAEGWQVEIIERTPLTPSKAVCLRK